MDFFNTYIRPLYFNNRLFLVLGCIAILFFTSLFLPVLFPLSQIALGLAVACTAVDIFLLFSNKLNLSGNRSLEMRMSIGANNEITATLTNHYSFWVSIDLIDELPAQLQIRDMQIRLRLRAGATEKVAYSVRPTTRGSYEFGRLLCYVSSPLGFAQRQIAVVDPVTVKVYPSFQYNRRHSLQLMATNDLTLPGSKRLKKLGQSLEFEKIKEYVPGDDARNINWKASARSNGLMVNTYADARQQQIYCLIDKGRNMKMPFDGMTLLDYAINASLAVLNVALMKQDKAGLITFSNKVSDIIPAERRGDHFHKIIETLYKQESTFLDADYEAVWKVIRTRITQRSLILLFTNFESYYSLERQLPFLQQVAKNHLICVVFFQNTLLEELQNSQPDDMEGVYIKTIANQFNYEKKQIVKELRRHGLLSILTTPNRLNADVISKYLELKASRML